MSLSNLGNILLVLAIIGYVGVRQVRWTPLDETRLWRLPAILGIIGAVMLVRDGVLDSLSTMDIAVAVIEVVVSVAIGAAMGRITRIRPLSAPSKGARLESSAGWLGLALWVLYIAARIGFGVWAGVSGSELGAATGLILVMVAVNRASSAAVLSLRLARLHPVTA